MGPDGDPNARYSNAAMTGYPSNEHVYSLPLRLGEYDAAQLIYALEDALGLVLSQYEHGQQTEGWATIDNLVPQLDLRTFAPLTDAQRAIVADVVGRHKPIPDSYGGAFRHVVTRYQESIGAVIVRHRDAGDERCASGFVFGRQDYLVTAAHVVQPPWSLVGVAFGDETVEASLVHRDDALDLAIVRLRQTRTTPPLPVRHLVKLPSELGTPCIVMGFPYVPGTRPSLSLREVRLTGVRENYVFRQKVVELAGDDLRGGFSGAPLLTLRHSVAGVIVGYPTATTSSGATQDMERGSVVCLPDAVLQDWFARA